MVRSDFIHLIDGIKNLTKIALCRRNRLISLNYKSVFEFFLVEGIQSYPLKFIELHLNVIVYIKYIIMDKQLIAFKLDYLLQCEKERYSLCKQFHENLLKNNSMIMNTLKDLLKIMENDSEEGIMMERISLNYQQHAKGIKDLLVLLNSKLNQAANIKIVKDMIVANNKKIKGVNPEEFNQNMVNPIRIRDNKLTMESKSMMLKKQAPLVKETARRDKQQRQDAGDSLLEQLQGLMNNKSRKQSFVKQRIKTQITGNSQK